MKVPISIQTINGWVTSVKQRAADYAASAKASEMDEQKKHIITDAMRGYLHKIG